MCAVILRERTCRRWWAVTVAAMLGPAACTNSTASRVVMCSMTILRSGMVATRGLRWRSMNTASRSKKSTSGSTT
jgi:hypothetical protein